MRNNPGVIVKRGDTEILLIGKRKNLFTEEYIGFRNPAFPYREVSLREINFYEKIKSKRLFKKAVITALGHLRANNQMDTKVQKESFNLINKEKYGQEIEEIVTQHIYLMKEDYDDLPSLSISKQGVIVKLQTNAGVKISINFKFNKAQYVVFLALSSEEHTSNFTRYRKLRNTNSLIKQLDDWSVENGAGTLLPATLPALKSLLIFYRFQLDTLITDINDFTTSLKNK